MKTDVLRRKPRAFRALTGLTVPVFDRVLADLQPVWEARRAKLALRKPRRRQPGAGAKPKLKLADRLLALLIYSRTYVSQEFVGVLLGVDASTICRACREVSLALAGVFRIPEKKVKLTEEEIAAAFVDATEQPTNRPKKRQKKWYSGKAKRHTIKHQVVVVKRRKQPGRRAAGQPPSPRKQRIAAVSPAAPGKVHDKKLYDRTRLRAPPGLRMVGDTAYQGTGLETPKKKPRGGELTKRQKAGNRRKSRERVAVEHGIGKMKIWRIARDKNRNPRSRHTLMMKNVAGFHNLMFA